jgi:hypothetical protein
MGLAGISIGLKMQYGACEVGFGPLLAFKGAVFDGYAHLTLARYGTPYIAHST